MEIKDCSICNIKGFSYGFSTKQEAWIKARDQCKDWKGRLTINLHGSDYKHLNSCLQKCEVKKSCYWIGLVNRRNVCTGKSVYQWYNKKPCINAAPLTINGQPNNDVKQAVAVMANPSANFPRAEIFQQTGLNYFICQKQLNMTTATTISTAPLIVTGSVAGFLLILILVWIVCHRYKILNKKSFSYKIFKTGSHKTNAPSAATAKENINKNGIYEMTTIAPTSNEEHVYDVCLFNEHTGNETISQRIAEVAPANSSQDESVLPVDKNQNNTQHNFRFEFTPEQSTGNGSYNTAVEFSTQEDASGAHNKIDFVNGSDQDDNKHFKNSDDRDAERSFNSFHCESNSSTSPNMQLNLGENDSNSVYNHISLHQ